MDKELDRAPMFCGFNSFKLNVGLTACARQRREVRELWFG